MATLLGEPSPTEDDALRIIDVPSQIDPQQPLAPQVVRMVDGVGLGPAEWQTTSILVNLPSLNHSAAALLAELHGRMGYWPAIVRLRSIENRVPMRFEVAEIVDLQRAREEARRRRT